IDCRPGVTPLGYMASTRLSDIVLIPTTTYKQALHGAKTLLNLLNPSSDDYARGGPPYGPERLLLFYSNIFKTGWRRDPTNGTIKLSKSLTKMIDETFGTPSPNERSIETIVLPHVVKLEDTEQFVTPSDDSITPSEDSRDDEAEPVYLRGIQRLRKQVEEVFSAKVEGQFSLAPTEAMFRPHALDSLLDAGDLSISVLVEAGAFGEQPFRELVKDSSVAKKFQGR